jgi:hypothetical protein
MNKEDAGLFVGLLIVAVLLIVLGASVGGRACAYEAKRSVHIEAIKKGFAQWKVDESGQITFEWKETNQ